MIRWYIFNILSYIVDYLGTLFGKTKWQRFQYALLWPLMNLYDTYNIDRRNRFYLININGQIIKLEHILNKTFDPVNKDIYITNFPGSYTGVWVGLEIETAPYLASPTTAEGEGFVAAPFVGATYDTVFAVTFTVHVPISLNGIESQIKTVVNNYKLAGKEFEIVYF